MTQSIFADLPVVLNANDAYPTIDATALPGGTFQPRVLQLTSSSVNLPLAPGDYAIPVLAFCNEYSVHQPGRGTAYKLAPYHGSAARAIAAMLWRGTARHMSPQSLEAVAFAIQSGVTYNQMPEDYRQSIDSLTPEYRGVLSGDIFAQLEAQYQVGRRIAALFHRQLPPTADEFYAQLGAPGRLVLAAKAQHARLLAIYQSPQRNQIVFAGQGSRLPPEPAQDGPWTVMVPGRAYLRFKIEGGNMQTNLVEVRILRSSVSEHSGTHDATVVFASYKQPEPVSLSDSGVGLSPAALLGSPDAPDAKNATGEVGYAQGGTGAQALTPVAVTNGPGPGPAPNPPVAAGLDPPPDPTARLLHNGEDITSQTVAVYAGQQVSLTLQLPKNALAVGSWSVPNSLGTWDGARGQQQHVDNPTSPDLSEPLAQFYWSTPGDYTVSHGYENGRQSFSVSAIFHVTAPALSAASTLDGPGVYVRTDKVEVNPSNQNMLLCGRNLDHSLIPTVKHGTRGSFYKFLPAWAINQLLPKYGVIFGVVPLSSPPFQAMGGTYEWVQTITQDYWGAARGSKKRHSPELDEHNPYNYDEKDPNNLNNANANLPMVGDEPYRSVSNTAPPPFSYALYFDATMYLLWTPPGDPATSTPVPLGSIEWSCHATEKWNVYHKKWVASGSITSDPFTPSTAYPTWNSINP